ncbi:carboxypeptidase regulatory-like domain-containing protein [Streptomyces sp. NPDC017524]|uniref:carboxypeptidase-like regulatory domain-containing protein n=1 Tax=unclassified Streptomyces TaxID=2593676 RepID=UPI0037BA5F00
MLNTEGRPVPRARLTLVDRGGRLLGQGEARADGSCELVLRGAESCILLAGATGHLPGATNLDLTTRALPGETVLLLREVTTVRGKVTEDALWMPIADALAVFMDERGKVAGVAVTSDGGYFEVAGLRPGGYTFLVLHQEFEHWLRPVFVGGAEPFLADATLTRRLFACRGVVRDDRGRPVPGVAVSLADGSGLELRERTDENGRFGFQAVPQGLYALGLANRPSARRVLVAEDLDDVVVILPPPKEILGGY